MRHSASLSRPAVEVGASLMIFGNQLMTGDSLEVVTSTREMQTVDITAFGIARLVLQAPNGEFECYPWKRDDEPIDALSGPASRWTVGRRLSSSR